MNPLEQAAIGILKVLVQTFGQTVVQGVLNTMLGPDPMLVEDVSMFIAGILRSVLEVSSESRVRAEVESMFAAGDVAAEAVETKVFGPR